MRLASSNCLVKLLAYVIIGEVESWTKRSKISLANVILEDILLGDWVKIEAIFYINLYFYIIDYK